MLKFWLHVVAHNAHFNQPANSQGVNPSKTMHDQTPSL